MKIELYDHQIKALKDMKNGCILCGETGSGKSRTSIAYYFLKNGGQFDPDYIPMKNPPQDLYIITTARKRDTLDWEEELTPFLLSTHSDVGLYSSKVVVDSWNNIQKYTQVENAFFIFDEQRVIGKGKWVTAFIRITRRNEWILLSATPGDKWIDYVPVFIANGFYKNRSEFLDEHAVIDYHVRKYLKIKGYTNVRKLERLRDQILVPMDYHNENVQHHEDIYCSYDNMLYREVMKKLWNVFEDRPLTGATDLCLCLQKVVNSDPSRIQKILELVEVHPRVVIFYNFDYELEILRNTVYGDGYSIAEWNGHKHEPIPDTEKWVYLVQYMAGNEGWNCTQTDTMIFYSQNYSYRTMVQASGRIDRATNTYHDLYYYHLRSNSKIDMAINKALKEKRKFNESKFSSGINFDIQRG